MKCKCSDNCKVELHILEPKQKELGKDYVQVEIRRKGIFRFKQFVLISKKELIEVISK